MSQDTFPFAADDDAADLEDSGRNRKAALLAGGVAAALVLGAGGYFLLGGGGSSDTTTSAFVPPIRHTTAAAAPKTAVKPAVKLPAAYKAPLGRDPFKALYVLPVVATTTTGTGTTAPSTGTTGATGTTTSPTGTTTGTGTTAPTSTRYALKLISISPPSPEVRFTTWSVAGTSKTVIPAQRFGRYGEIVVLAFSKNASGAVDAAIIQVGDDSPIAVKVGESVSVL